MGSSNNGYISRYTYDAFGQRAIKSHGETQGVFINGAPSGFVEHKQNYQLDVSPYFTVYEHEYRKHFFINDLRIISKIGTGIFQTNLASSPEISAGNIDYKNRIQQYEFDILAYYAALGVPPGPPTLLALLGQPEFNSTGLPNTINQDPYTLKPSNWPNIAPPDSTGPPGPPVFYEFTGITNENVEAGFNYSAGKITEELEQFFYHYDVYGNTVFITGSDGNVRQHNRYFPSGELWIQLKRNDDISNYSWNAWSFDPETDLYYMGELYYDPVSNVELSLDPILQNFGSKTIDRRKEGALYYDFANFTDTEDHFDEQIINSERPSPLTVKAAQVIDKKDLDQAKEMDYYRDEIPSHATKKGIQDVKNLRRKITISRDTEGKHKAHEIQAILDEYEIKQLQSREGFEVTDVTSFNKLRLDAEKNKARKNKIKSRRKNTKRKVTFRVQ